MARMIAEPSSSANAVGDGRWFVQFLKRQRTFEAGVAADLADKATRAGLQSCAVEAAELAVHISDAPINHTFADELAQLREVIVARSGRWAA